MNFVWDLTTSTAVMAFVAAVGVILAYIAFKRI